MAKKYIDTELLQKEIEKRIKNTNSCPFIQADFGIECRREGKMQGYKETLALIDSLQQEQQSEYVRKDMVIDAIKLAYGKVSKNPFDCSDAFEELLNKVGA